MDSYDLYLNDMDELPDMVSDYHMDKISPSVDGTGYNIPWWK